MPPSRSTAADRLQGTLDVLLLKTLTWGPLHGYAIARWIERVTDDALRIEEGSLYPALHRLERHGWVTSDWGLTDTGRRAKFYRLSAQGRAQLRAEQSSWERFADAVGKVLGQTARDSQPA
jgi:PadR family transcriptional regulator PadR